MSGQYQSSHLLPRPPSASQASAPNKKGLRTATKSFYFFWWRWRELNPRPLECHSSALPTELHPHEGIFVCLKLRQLSTVPYKVYKNFYGYAGVARARTGLINPPTAGPRWHRTFGPTKGGLRPALNFTRPTTRWGPAPAAKSPAAGHPWGCRKFARAGLLPQSNPGS